MELYNRANLILERVDDTELGRTSMIFIYLQGSVFVQNTRTADLWSSCDLTLQTHEFVMPLEDLFIFAWVYRKWRISKLKPK